MKIERELMRGAGPIAVMTLLGGREMYGYELVQALSKRSDGILNVGQSTLYPMLYNLEAKGLITSRVEEIKNGRQRRYYKLTSKGRRKLEQDRKQWISLSQALSALGAEGGAA